MDNALAVRNKNYSASLMVGCLPYSLWQEHSGHCNVAAVLWQDRDVFEPHEAFETSAPPVHSLTSSEHLHFVDKCGKDLWLASLPICRRTIPSKYSQNSDEKRNLFAQTHKLLHRTCKQHCWTCLKAVYSITR